MMKQNEVELDKQRESTKIEVEKFQQMVDALGAQTIESMASAGNNHQIKMLQLGCPTDSIDSLFLDCFKFSFHSFKNSQFDTLISHLGSLQPLLLMVEIRSTCCRLLLASFQQRILKFQKLNKPRAKKLENLSFSTSSNKKLSSNFYKKGS